jgi:hypothetical protein
MDEAFQRPSYDPTDTGRFVPDTVFVVMSFSPDLDESYRAIQDGASELGLRAERADDSVGSGIILSQITKSIEDAEFVVVDLTNERPNVYYELGYAHGVGNASADILLVAREGTALHFDIAPLRVRYYSSAAELAEIAKQGLAKMIDATRRQFSASRQKLPSGGLFSLTLETPAGLFGGGVALFHKGIIHGGGDSYFYSGRYKARSGETIDGTLNVRHYQGPLFTELGSAADMFHLEFVARKSDSGDGLVGDASVPGRRRFPLKIRGNRIADALA